MDAAVALRGPLVTSARLACLAIVPFVALGGARLDDPFRISSWDSVSRLSEARSYLGAIAIGNGKILVVGGIDPFADSVMRRQAELVDVTSGASVAIDGPRVARIGASLSLLPNGDVLLAGGADRVDGSWYDVSSVEVFDVRAARWRDVAALRGPRSNHGAVTLPDGRVLIVGGQLGARLLDSAELFDPATEKWTAAARLPETRAYFSLAALPDGRALLAGGLAAALATRTSLLYDPRRDAWQRGPDLALDRMLNATVTLANGDILLVGGQRSAAGSAERFDVRAGAFVSSGTLVWPRMIPLAARLADGRVLVVGGLPRPQQILDHFGPTATTELYDPATERWTPGPPLGQGVAVAALITTKRAVWLLGGASEGEVAVDAIAVLR